jgi:hypothetical protein
MKKGRFSAAVAALKGCRRRAIKSLILRSKKFGIAACEAIVRIETPQF